MSKQVQKVCNAISTAAVVLVVILALLLVGVRLVGLRPMCVLSGSMEPTYHTGSLIYVKPCAPEDVQVGDAITFVLNEDLDVVTHRVISIDAENEHFYTQGDANDAPDGAPVYFKNLIGRPVFTIPYLGYVSHWVSNPPGMYLAIALVLVVALAVGATWAYLTAQSGPVTNTFTVGSVIAQGGFELKEHEVEYNNATGLYAFKDGMVETDANTYDQLAPMTTAPKDPFVKFSKEIKSPAYLFVKVTDTTTGITANVDTTKWTELTGDDLKLGANEKLYAYKDVITVGAHTDPYYILANNQISTSATEVIGGSLVFNGYLCQAAGFESARAAYVGCFAA